MSKQTTQELQIEKPINDKKVETLCKKALLQVTRLENKKSQIIKKLAQELEEEAHVPRSSISSIITRHLEGYVTAQYVGRCLNPDQKDNRKVRHNTGRKQQKLDKERTVETHNGDGNGHDSDNGRTYDIQRQLTKSGDIKIKMMDEMCERRNKNKAISGFRIYFNDKLDATNFEELLN